MPSNNQISLTIIVSGTSETVKVNPHQEVEVLVRKALVDSGNAGQPPDRWELRRESGQLIDQDVRIGESGISDGDTLTLQPRAGAGG